MFPSLASWVTRRRRRFSHNAVISPAQPRPRIRHGHQRVAEHRWKIPPLKKSCAVTALAWVCITANQPTAFEGLINFSAATIEWLKNQLALIHDSAEVEQLAVSVKDNGGVYLVPAFAGLSAPYWSPQARAAIMGMTAHTGKAHVVRTPRSKPIAYQIRDVLDIDARRTANIKLKNLHADGGPTRNKFLMQFTADLAQTEIKEHAGSPESSAWGATMNGPAVAGRL